MLHNPAMTTKTLLLVDGSSYLYRAYHALPDLRSPDGFPTGAIHGMVAMLKRALQDVQPEHAACVFDAKGDTFRNEWYPEYKAQRAPMPEDLVRQIEPIHEVVKLLGWPVLVVPGIEADDAIGTIARRAAESGHRVIVSTGDKDLAQLVNDQVTLINTMSNERLDVPGVLAKFGVAPERIVDYLTLVGDTVDNVPGVDGCGPKTAGKWLAEFDTLDGVMAQADSIKGKAGEKLRAALGHLPLSRQLVTIKLDVDLQPHLPSGLEALQHGSPRPAELIALYRQCGFRTWLRELDSSASDTPSPPAAAPLAQGSHTDLFADAAPVASTPAPASVAPAHHAETPSVAPDARHYTTLTDLASLQAWIHRLRAAPVVSFDTETTSLDPQQG